MYTNNTYAYQCIHIRIPIYTHTHIHTYTHLHTHFTIGTCISPLDLVFVVDSSGSINFHDKHNWVRVLSFMKEVVDRVYITQL